MPSSPEELRGLVKRSLNCLPKGGQTVGQRGVNESSKGGKQFTPNNNSNNNRSNKRCFTPPTLEEVKTYVTERGNIIDAVKFYEYFTEGEWFDSNGKKVKNWKQKMRGVWFKDENKIKTTYNQVSN